MKKGSKTGLHNRKGNASLLSNVNRPKQRKVSKKESAGWFFNKFGERVHVLKSSITVHSKK